MRAVLWTIAVIVILVVVAGGGIYAFSGDRAKLSETTAVGPMPTIPSPDQTLIPTVDVAKATGWPQGRKPSAANGFEVNAFATGLDHPRWLYVLPNGDVLVAETNAPYRPDDGKGVKGFVYREVQKYAGAGVPSANRITLLRDNGSGTATKSAFLKSLFALRHDARRQRPLCRQCRCDHAVSL